MVKKTKVSKDRISVLSDPILHHIMSFMDMKDVLKTSRLSKRWRSLWRSVPVLNFKLIRNSIFLDRVLYGHCKDSNLHRFCISSSSSYGLRDSDFYYWMRIADERHVQEVQIEHNGFDSTNITDFIFTSDIKIFKLNTVNINFMTPISMGLAPQLRSLDLKNSRILENDLTEEVGISCPLLENLKLTNCEYSSDILRISAPLLKNVFIERKRSKDVCEKKLIISTGKLESLVLKGIPFRKYVLRNLGSLVNADIQFNEPIRAQTLLKLLKGLYKAENLKLSCQLKQPTYNMDWCLPSFVNLRRLKIFNFSDGSCIHYMIYNLLINCRQLEALSVGISQVKNNKRDFTELSQCISSLKSIEIQGIRGSKSEMNFFEFVLKTGGALQSFVLWTTDTFSQYTLKERAIFQMKIHTLPRASPRVKILLQTIINSDVNTRSS